MRKTPFLTGAALLALFAAQPMLAQTSTQTTPGTQRQGMTDQGARNVDAATKDFVRKAWNIDNFELRAGQHALNKTNNQALRDYATMIVADHNNAEAELKPIVDAAGMTMPTAPGSLDEEHQSKLDKLGGLNGAQFDYQFRQQQIDGHERALTLFRDYAKNGKNPELKNWAQRSVSMLERHLSQAKALPRGAEKGASAD
jgi:putative membrane protein